MTFEAVFDVMDRFLRHTVSPVFRSETSSLRPSNRGVPTCKNQTVLYGTALLGWRCSRHFVPGYDRTVAPGQNHSPIGGFALS
jgi:hypothetical protein